MKSYGTTSVRRVNDAATDLERADGSGARTPAAAVSNDKLDNDDMQPLLQGDGESIVSGTSHDSAQAGVKRLEAISSTWSKSGLLVAYVGIALLSYAVSLESQTTNNLTIYATSAFRAHSLVSTVLVVQGVVLSVAKPPMSKIADVFGRLEAFSLAIVLYVFGYIQQAAAASVDAYAVAQVFYSAGQTGLQILVQILIADTSDLVNRSLCTTIPSIPYLINVWVGPALADRILKSLNWRWGYGIWAIVLPVAFLPLAISLTVSQRRAAQRGILPKSLFVGKSWHKAVVTLWYELDFFGLLLICVAFALLLIPLTLAAKAGWRNPSIASMLSIGAVCLIAIPFWERNRHLAPHPFFPRAFWQNRTIIAGIMLSFFYFMAFYLSVYPYFQSYLLVVHGLSITTAGQIVQTFTFTATITSLIVSMLIKYTKNYKKYLVTGTCIYAFALLLMIRYRSQESSITMIVGTQVFLGIGGSLTNVPAQLGVQASASHSEVAAATALFLTLMEIGGAVGSAISGAIWTSDIPGKLNKYLPPETRGQAAEIYANISLAANGWPMGSPTRQAINLSYQETMTKILTVALCVSIPCIVLSLLMEDYKLGEIDQGVKGVVIGGTQERVDHSASEPHEGPVTTERNRHDVGDDDYTNDEDAEDDDDVVQRQESRSLLLPRGAR